jgi:hypothetical protein
MGIWALTMDFYTLKLRVYASAGIAAYWILNLVERQLEV